MSHCAVSGCSNRQLKCVKNRDIKFYRFPKAKDFCKEWVKFCGRKEIINVKNARICSEHFTASCSYKSLQHKLLQYSPKNRRRLMPDAVPSEKGPISTEAGIVELASPKKISCRKDLFNEVRSIEVCNWEEKYKELQQKFNELEKKMEAMKAENVLLKQQLQNKTDNAVIAKAVSIVFTKGQIKKLFSKK
ncbi:hypothetical protein Zmor_016528 [Zophobas morio]|uniref:THAP-type domain-containing protein n=1 Tax=Zophobas morio TaxID=2755281 RepID=A0AA38IAD7_9CUCU|nr:hypothetical protein Zmor_016528 [Zophobas morio]